MMVHLQRSKQHIFEYKFVFVVDVVGDVVRWLLVTKAAAKQYQCSHQLLEHRFPHTFRGLCFFPDKRERERVEIVFLFIYDPKKIYIKLNIFRLFIFRSHLLQFLFAFPLAHYNTFVFAPILLCTLAPWNIFDESVHRYVARKTGRGTERKKGKY